MTSVAAAGNPAGLSNETVTEKGVPTVTLIPSAPRMVASRKSSASKNALSNFWYASSAHSITRS